MNRGISSTIVRSADGTSIVVEHYGEGPALAVVPGALSDLTSWMACAPLLAHGRSVLVIDRRGRGGSGDAASYEPELEIEDVLAVLAAAGGPADLLGHSSGAILALQAAERTPRELRRLVLYEPPVFLEEDDRIPTDLPERLDALLASGDEDVALETFLREGPRSPDAEIRGSRRHPVWSRMLTMARTAPYDARIQLGFDLDLRRLATMGTPTLMLIGTQSPSRMRNGSEAIAKALPAARIEELPGQGHIAHVLAPGLLADAVDRFLSGD
jgi:pimeloyl-ACP methyl ester carboxylesterase